MIAVLTMLGLFIILSTRSRANHVTNLCPEVHAVASSALADIGALVQDKSEQSMPGYESPFFSG